MSIRCIEAVWRGSYRRGGNHRLALLALADFARDDGSEIRPSMATLAERMCCSTKQARRVVHDLLDDGVIEIVQHGKRADDGRNEGTPRVYRLRLDRLTTPVGGSGTSPSDGSGTSPAAGSRDDAPRLPPVGGDVSHGGTQRLPPVGAYPSLTVKNLKAAPSAPSESPDHLPANLATTAQASPIAATTETRPPPPAASPRDAIWGLGVRLLTAAGLSESSARSFLGRMARQDERKLAEVLAGIAVRPVADPRAYISAAMQPRRREFVA